ncbi:hypothetical protein F4818DRAFT_430780 [Hypoxylon cercidicola]|nr:hypothetical protein F4818DRAFT_430780 [Hypoxylon cercidicola]
MAPSVDALEKDLRNGVRAVVAEGGWDTVTVNTVRNHVEKKRGLKKGFFKTDDWEARSKKIIKEFVAQLLAEEEEKPSSPPAATLKTEPKNGVKRHSSDEPSPAPKRQKKASRATSSKEVKSKKEQSESELSDLNDLSEFEQSPKKAAVKKATRKSDSDSDLSDLSLSEDEPQKAKAKPKKSASRRKSKKEETESELSDLGDSEEEPKKKAKAPKKAASRRKSKNGVKGDEEEASDLGDSSADKKRKRTTSTKKQSIKRAKVESDSEDDLIDKKEEAAKDEAESDVDVNIDANTTAKSSPEATATHALKTEELNEDAKPKDSVDEDTKVAKADDSDSELSSVLDEPPPKRKSKEPKGASKPKKTKELSGDETEIKKLQAQLVKCGIRKIWGFELKKYGDDNKGKIRHLKEMLREAGIEGRFSEAKAKEVKERRELMADLEAVTEMNRNWGRGGGRGRASRSEVVKKPLKGESDEDVANEDDEDEVKANPRVSKRMADLAFLGDDSESD